MIITEKQDIANLLNEYFSTIGKKINESVNNDVDTDSLNHDRFLHGNFKESMFMQPITEADMMLFSNLM